MLRGAGFDAVCLDVRADRAFPGRPQPGSCSLALEAVNAAVIAAVAVAVSAGV